MKQDSTMTDLINLEFRPEICDLCESNEFRILIDLRGRVMTSDRKISNGRIKKIQCIKCGLVRNGIPIKKSQLKQEYKKKYTYNTSKNGDNFFFTTSGHQERSMQIFEWMTSFVGNSYLSKIKTIVEMGCGQGNLLAKFAQHFPDKKIIGLELNEEAIRIGRKKGLDIRHYENAHDIRADMVISYAVIEHTPSPKNFIQQLNSMLNPNGIIVIGQPHQDILNYDIFFTDHLYHFSTNHIQELGRISNLIQVKKSTKAWPIDSFSLHLFRKSNERITQKTKYYKTKVMESIKYYNRIFDKVNTFLRKNKSTNMAVFGLGEIFSIFCTYSDLGETKISYGIDDFPKNKKEFPFPVISSNEVKNHNIDTILLCVNPKYYKILLKRLQPSNYNILFPFEKKP